MKQSLKYPVTYMERTKERRDVWVGDLPTSRANAMPQKFNPHQSLKNTLRGGDRIRERGGEANRIRIRKLSD
ncbi:MAG: hypothetical protein WB811_02410 [Methanoregula sp.]|uniref:hypothetical protein n=1 Tax=Methanoregula sp. TaxID=2052170 RepID=UPI003BB1C872